MNDRSVHVTACADGVSADLIAKCDDWPEALRTVDLLEQLAPHAFICVYVWIDDGARLVYALEINRGITHAATAARDLPRGRHSIAGGDSAEEAHGAGRPASGGARKVECVMVIAAVPSLPWSIYLAGWVLMLFAIWLMRRDLGEFAVHGRDGVRGCGGDVVTGGGDLRGVRLGFAAPDVRWQRVVCVGLVDCARLCVPPGVGPCRLSGGRTP